MRITFENILNEDRNPKQQKFIDMIVDEMKSYYEGRYEGTHWVDATHGLSLEQIQKYRGYVDKVKRLGEEMKKYDGMFQNVEGASPRGLREKIEKYWDLSNQYRDALYGVAHLADMFSRNDWATPNFLENYAVPVGVLLDAWEQFFHDVYTPGKIEYNKTKSGLDLLYGLPEGNYSTPKKYHSIWGTNRYAIFKDNTHNDFILGIDVDWKWRENGIDMDKLYYKPFKTEKDMFDTLKMMEKNHFKEQLKGASVHLESNQIDEIIAHLNKVPMFRYEQEAEEEQTRLTYIISEYVDHFANWDRGYNMSHDESQSFAHYYIDYKDAIEQFN